MIFAQLAEAKALIDQTGALPVEGEKARVWSEGEMSCLYGFERGWIAISGVGLHAAQMAVAKYAHLGSEIWNLGLAGSLRGSLPVGECLSIESVGKYLPLEEEALDAYSQECVAFTLPTFFLGTGSSALISSDFPIHDAGHRARLGKTWDLVDMEGYGIAFAAQVLKKKCRIWKIVSDFASPGGRELIRKHKSMLSEQMAQKVLSECAIN
jgi:adenosylhomocysteine nucleosidase